jgi:tetratricopeptide (TPR) repeat protein
MLYIQQQLERNDPEANTRLSDDLRTVAELDQDYVLAERVNKQKKSGAAIEELLKLKTDQERFAKQWIARTNIQLGDAYYGEGHFAQAEQIFEGVLWVAESLDEVDLQGEILLKLGDARRRRGFWQRSLEHYSAAEEIFYKIGDNRKVADCWRKQAGVYLFQGRPYLAEPLCMATIDQCKEIGYNSGVAKGLQHLAWACYMTGRWDEGIQYTQNSLRLVKSDWERVKALRYLGDAYRLARRLDDAKDKYLEALAMLKKMEKDDERTSVKLISGLIQLGLGKLYLKTPGQEREAAKCLNEGQIYSGLGEDFRVADFLGEQGALLLKFGRFEDAEQRLLIARNTFLELENIYHYANILASYCALYDARRNERDIEAIFRIVEDARKLDNEHGVLNFHLASIEFFAGKAYLHQGNLPSTFSAWRAASEYALQFNALAFEETGDEILGELLSVARRGEVNPALQLCNMLIDLWAKQLENKELDMKRQATVRGALSQIRDLQTKL